MKILLTVSCMLCVVVVHGQEIGNDSSTVLNELVISANKIPEMRSNVAQQIELVSQQKIISLNAQSTADLISTAGLLTVQKSQQGGGSPQIRGFEASRVVLVVDGVRMNNLIYRAGHLQNVITIDNSILERVEILYGPSSTIYGSDALGGVIHFKTRDPIILKNAKRFGGNAYLRYGSVNNEKTFHADFNIAGKKLGSLSSITISDFDDLKMGKKTNRAFGDELGLRKYYVERSLDNQRDILVENENPYVQKFSDYRQYDFLQKFLFKQSSRVAHILNFQFSTSSNIPRYDRLTDPDTDGLRSAEWYYGPQKRLMIAYELSVNDVGTVADFLRTTISYQDIEESRHDRRFNRPTRRNQIEQVKVVGVNIDFQKSLSQNSIRYGFEGQFSSVQSTAFNFNIISKEKSPAATRYPDGGNDMQFAALYGTHTVDLSKKLVLNDGIRIGYSHLNSGFNDKTFFPFPFDEVDQQNFYASGNVGLIYKPEMSWRLAVVGSTGYRVPNVDDLGKVFDTQSGNALIVPNPEVKPEKTINADVSISKSFWENKLKWENTFFYTSFFDAIVLDDFTFNGQSTVMYEGKETPVLANQNKRKAFLTGYSSRLNTTISKTLSANISYNYTYGRIKEGAERLPLDHVSPSFGRVGIQYQEGKIMAEVFSNFNGWKRIENYFLNGEDNEQYATAEGMPSWYTINVRVTYNINDVVKLQAGADNLLDLQYRTFASGINAPGRNFSFTARFKF